MPHRLLQVSSREAALSFKILSEGDEPTKDHPPFNTELNPIVTCTPVRPGRPTTEYNRVPYLIKSRAVAVGEM
jgi:hypothetical protein